MRDLYKSLAGLAKQKEKRLMPRKLPLLIIITRSDRVLIAEDGEVNMLLAKTIIRSIAPNSEIIEAKNGLTGGTGL
jgi:hypothetical protein